MILHTTTSHGPLYNTRYPSEFEVFQPIGNTVEMSKCPHDQLMNSYDNTIVYTDYIINETIKLLESLPEWHSTMMFVSDHGESLGENNLFMHGVPISIAPAEQYEIPFIVWCSDGTDRLIESDLLSQYHVFHSVLGFMGIGSPVYDPEKDIFNR